MASFYLKRRDTRPVMRVALLNPDGTAHDLTGAGSVTLHVSIDGAVLSRAMVVDPAPATGIVRYTWLDTDWSSTPALDVGRFRMEYEVIAGTSRLTFPNSTYDELIVIDDIGQA